MIKKINSITDPVVFWTSNLIIFLLIIFTVSSGNSFVIQIELIKDYFLGTFGWAFVLPIIWLIFYTGKILFKFGHVRIGGENAKTEFSTFSWLSMLFSAGLGIGLLYSGVYEPMAHYFIAPQISDLEGHEKFLRALDMTYFHWGLPAWIIYSATGLMFAYIGFNKNKPLLFAEYIPEKYKSLRSMVNIFAILSILVGVITAFALGVEQINSGLNEVFPSIQINKPTQALIIFIITIFSTLSVLSGLKKGIKFLSEINIWIAASFLIFVTLSCVSISQIIEISVQTTGSHLTNFINALTYVAAFENKDWMSNWTILYWAWWASWAPFVGLFIARISKGRTIREFISYTIAAPSIMCFIWFTVFGVAGFQIHEAGIADFSVLVNESPHKSLFVVLQQTFAPYALSILAVISIIIFYVTSSDSGSYIIDMIASGGKKSNSYLKIYWSLTEGLLAIVLVLFGGTLFIKNLVILFSLPIVLYICYGIYKLDSLLKEDYS